MPCYFLSPGREESVSGNSSPRDDVTEACRQNARGSGQGGFSLGWGIQGDFLAEVASLGP